MIERAKTMRFAPGAFVFPGGKVDKQDYDADFLAHHTNGASDLPDFAFRIAALRELYEEAGVLITDQSPTTAKPAVTTKAGLSLFERLGLEKAKLNILDMVAFAHWVTPEPMPRRFDTHFYIVEHNGGTAKHDGNEAVSLCWVKPSLILDDWDSDKVPLMFPTRLNLMKLARANTVAEAMEQARAVKVVRTLPVIGRDKNGVNLTIDPATGYSVTRASFKELRVESSK